MADCTCQSLKNLVMIEYPGFVQNVEKAATTLGGTETIQRIVNSGKDRLQLRFRIADPLSHPAYGDRVPTKSLLVRIKKKVNKAPLEPSQGGSCNDSDYSIELLGKIHTTFKFTSLAEFQILPMVRTNLSNIDNDMIERTKSSQTLTIQRTEQSLKPTYRSILSESLPIKDPFDNTLKSLNADCPLIVLPAVFSRFDTPRETVHQPPKFRSKEMREEFERQQGLAIIGRTRKKRATMSFRLNQNDEVPHQAPEKLLKERSVLSPPESKLLPRLKECFEKQKVWSKAALCYELECSSADIKYILPLVAFHYLTGPFRTMWVKYGYNPHHDKSSKILQTLDFRVRHSGNDNNNPNDSQYSRRSIHQYQLPLKRGIDKSKKSQQTDLKTSIAALNSSRTSSLFDQSQAICDQTIDSASVGKTEDHSQMDEAYEEPIFNETLEGSRSLVTEAMFKFREDLRPPARQMSYQLKDIEVDEVMMIIHSNDGIEPDECSEKDGWFPDGTIEKIRKIMNNIMNTMFGNISDQLVEIDVDPGSPLLVDYE